MPDRTASARRHLLVLGDSLTYFGPEGGVLLGDDRLYANVAAERLRRRTGEDWQADIVARLGWTARDVWWAVSMDPRVYSTYLPRASVVVLAVGNMDYMAASIPTYLREGIRHVRPAVLRRQVRGAYRVAHPRVVRVTRGRVRMLPQPLTDDYLSRCAAGIRAYHPATPLLGVVPAPSYAREYGYVTAGHAAAVRAARAWGDREGVPLLDLPVHVGPELAAGRANPDGMHFGWGAHRAVGEALSDLVEEVLRGGVPPDGR